MFGRRSKLTQLIRLIPFCERNYNLIELGPKGTGKSHLYSEFSPHGILISGGEVTVPKLFVSNASGKIGLVGYWDCIAFDEFAGKQKRVDKALVDIMKNYINAEINMFNIDKKIIDTNIMNYIEKYNDYVDQYFVTTDKNYIQTSIPRNKLNFIPVPCSNTTENLNLYQTRNHEFDIFYAVSHGVNRGILKKNKIDERYNFLKLLMSKSIDITYNIFGFNNVQPVWGNKFLKEISKCKFALNLSRGQPVKYYSSNRIASLVANGIPTLIDKKVKFNDFFSNKEMIFYEDIYDLIDKINFYKKNERKRIQIGINGKNKYFKIFNNRIVADYIVSKTLGNKPSYKYIWDK